MPENIESLQNLDENLKEQGSSISTMPIVYQYNKRDMKDVASTEYMDFLINNGPIRVPVVNGVACDGEGVFETLNAISKLVLNDFIQKKNQG
jgi:signal recognition particle receptor subunit beta